LRFAERDWLCLWYSLRTRDMSGGICGGGCSLYYSRTAGAGGVTSAAMVPGLLCLYLLVAYVLWAGRMPVAVVIFTSRWDLGWADGGYYNAGKIYRHGGGKRTFVMDV